MTLTQDEEEQQQKVIALNAALVRVLEQTLGENFFTSEFTASEDLMFDIKAPLIFDPPDKRAAALTYFDRLKAFLKTNLPTDLAPYYTPPSVHTALGNKQYTENRPVHSSLERPSDPSDANLPKDLMIILQLLVEEFEGKYYTDRLPELLFIYQVMYYALRFDFLIEYAHPTTSTKAVSIFQTLFNGYETGETGEAISR